jgi:hypothetical protein
VPSTTHVDLCVVHLVRKGGDFESFERFLASYVEHPSGVPHRFVLLAKGFRSPTELRRYEEAAGSLLDETVQVSDAGFDLTAYATLAGRVTCEQLCFLNSNSAILDAGWLAKLHAALTPDVGIVGATGSWNSAFSSSRYFLHLPSAYGELFPDRVWLRAQLYALATAMAEKDARAPSFWAKVGTAIRENAGTVYVQFAFPPFPARHVRTNAFLIRSDVLRRLRIGTLHWKQQAWRLESGRGGITSQIEKMGLRALVVGRDGVAYEPSDWYRSATLWQESQQNLLVADNQTDAYASGDLDRRTVLSRLAWGNLARPSS